MKAHSERNASQGMPTDSIRAWHGTKSPASRQPPPAKSKDELLRSVDTFLASHHQQQQRSGGTQPLSERLYRSDVALDEANAKLQEW